MNAKQFFEEVAKMRRLQKECSKSRTSMTTNSRKAQERVIDKEIERVLNITGNNNKEQTNLFK